MRRRQQPAEPEPERRIREVVFSKEDLTLLVGIVSHLDASKYVHAEARALIEQCRHARYLRDETDDRVILCVK